MIMITVNDNVNYSSFTVFADVLWWGPPVIPLGR